MLFLFKIKRAMICYCLFLAELLELEPGQVTLRTEKCHRGIWIFKEILPLSESLSIISFNVASSWDTDLLIMPTHVSVGTLVSDQSLTDGGVISAGKFWSETDSTTDRQSTQLHVHSFKDVQDNWKNWEINSKIFHSLQSSMCLIKLWVIIVILLKSRERALLPQHK